MALSIGILVYRNKRRLVVLITGLIFIYLMYAYTSIAVGQIRQIFTSLRKNTADVKRLPQQINYFHNTSTVSSMEHQKTTKASSVDFFLSKLGQNSGPCQNILKHEHPVSERLFFKVAQRPIYVFSAFYDHRSSAGGPLVRIISSGLQGEYNKIGALHCILWFREFSDAIDVVAEYHRIYHSSLFHDEYTAHFITCTLHLSVGEPIAVAVVEQRCKKPGHALPVIINRRPPQSLQKLTFGLCISPLYNFYDNTEELIEFIEIHRILGVDRITFYDFAIGPSVAQTLQSYAKNGVVDVIPWKIPTNVRQNYFMQREALNDCLYRNMDRVDFLAANDLDEVIVPRKMSSWSDMMKNISSADIGAYLFQHVYFRRNITRTTVPHFITQTSFTRVDKAMPAGKIRCKSIYSPEKALKIDIHFPYALVPGFNEKIIEEEVAILHHYRATPMQTFQNTKNNFRFIIDEYMTKFGPELSAAYKRKIKAKL